MSTNKLLVDERQADIGNFLVGRLLPFRKKRQVGPFTFIDHMGPATIELGNYFDIDQHPHIGLCTLTYLLEGQIEHRDSTGAVQIISPGDVGFMTAGKAVTHTERTPQKLRDGRAFNMHGYQIWVALPKAMEECEPRFDFVPHQQLPQWKEGPLSITLVAGEAFGKQAPLLVHSPLFMVDIKASEEYTLDLSDKIDGEVAFVLVAGEMMSGDTKISQGQMLISKSNQACSICLQKGTRILLFGGQPLDGERYLRWNFVSSSKDRLNQATKDWKAKKFPKVPGDETYIPIPELRR
jgi:redox-sensitive bicupin YhaK (pirin superfamily)